jgi:hypothetical protein
MDYGKVTSIKMEIPLSEFGVEHIELTLGDATEEVDPWYISNLDDRNLGNALLQYAKTKKEMRFDIPLEPGVARWLFVPVSEDVVGVQMLLMPEAALVDDISDADGTVQFMFECKFTDLVNAYRLMLHQFRDEHGVDKYEEELGENFPKKELEALDKLVSS